MTDEQLRTLSQVIMVGMLKAADEIRGAIYSSTDFRDGDWGYSSDENYLIEAKELLEKIFRGEDK